MNRRACLCPLFALPGASRLCRAPKRKKTRGGVVVFEATQRDLTQRFCPWHSVRSILSLALASRRSAQ
jgi:hypothetical protein